MKTNQNHQTPRRPTRNAAKPGHQTRAPEPERLPGRRQYADFLALCLYPGMALEPVAPDRIPAA